MNVELIFRVIFSTLWLIFLANVVWVGYSGRALSSSQERRGTGLLRAVAIALAFPYFAGAVFYSLVPSWITFLSIPLPYWFRWLMGCLAMVGVLFAVWALRVLGANWAPSLSEVRKDAALITTGPYSIVRNPIYLGILIALPSLSLLAANWLTTIPGFILCILLYNQVGAEEATLVDHFGPAYLEYMKRTPRLVPMLRQISDANRKETH